MGRPDLDGLRGLAILLVVAGHVGLPFVGGGYVGVDVFFVLSGYVITQQLERLRALPPTAMLAEFFARRVRRILPAFTVVLVTVLIAARLLLTWGEQQETGKSGAWAAIFASNVFFLHRGADYFAAAANSPQPLLHTWSLAVEEQFYLLWPLALLALWQLEARLPRRIGRYAVPCALGVLVIASLAWAFASQAVDAQSAFFLAPLRAWELGAGALLAVLPASCVRASTATALGGTGLVLVGTAALQARGDGVGLSLIAAVVGTVALIAAGRGTAAATAPLQRMLAWRPLALTGELSYAWYLWHWPLLAIARWHVPDKHDPMRDIALAGLAYGLAFVSTRWLEQPIRNRRSAPWTTPRATLLAGAGLVIVGVASSSLLWKVADSDFRAALAPASLDCVMHDGQAQSVGRGACVLAEGSIPPALFLIGDSHADHWSPAVAIWARAHGSRAVERAYSACPLAASAGDGVDYLLADAVGRDCVGFAQSVVTEIRANAVAGVPTVAIIAIHWSAYVSDGDPALRARIERGLAANVDALRAAGVRLLLIGPTPEFARDPPGCLRRLRAEDCELNRSEHDRLTASARALLADFALSRPDIGVFDPSAQFCDARACTPGTAALPLFRDRSHLSRRGAEAAAPELGRVLDRLVAPMPSVR